MLVNEGLPLYLVSKLERQYDLATLKVGLLGMAFKGESDDTRSSLAYKLRRILRFRAASVLATDPYVTSDQTLLPLEQVLFEADLLIVAAPHDVYRSIDTPLPVVDVWNLLGRGTRV
jgi:UDP-N-acetyl-D-mannosaminuronic acid dehydrogenase